jgi:hypothetical protein
MGRALGDPPGRFPDDRKPSAGRLQVIVPIQARKCNDANAAAAGRGTLWNASLNGRRGAGSTRGLPRTARDVPTALLAWGIGNGYDHAGARYLFRSAEHGVK